MPIRKRMPRRRFRKGARKMALKRAITNKNQNTFSTACKWNAGITITPGPGGSGPTNYLYFTSSALTGTASLQYTREHVLFSKIYDQYRVTGVTMKFIPAFNVANIADALEFGQESQVLYSSWDMDSALPSSSAAIQTLRSTRKHNIRRPFKRTFRYTYKDNSWLDTGSTYDVAPPVSNWVSKGLYGNFGFYGENLPYPTTEAITVGQIEVIYHVVYRGQRLVNVSQDESGQILLGNPEPTMKPTSDLVVTTTLKPLADDNECDLDVPVSSK